MWALEVKIKKEEIKRRGGRLVSTLGNARVWFDDLPPESIDNYDDLKKAFLENYLQQKKYIKDPIELHNITQRDGETRRFRKKIQARKQGRQGASECMRIFGFVHGITNPELIKRLHDKILKTVDEMMRAQVEESNDENHDETNYGGIHHQRGDYYSGITKTMINGKAAYELKGKFLDDLLNNAFRAKTYEEYENEWFYKLNNDPEKLWSENRVPYELIDHICELFHFKDGKTKWPTCSSNDDGFCNGGELPRMVRVGYMTYFQYYNWYDDFYDEEEGSYGLKDLDAYSIGTTLLDDALPRKEKRHREFHFTIIVKHPKGIAEIVLVGIDKFVFPVDFIVLDMPEDIKTLFILERPFLSTTHTKIDVFKRKITLRVENNKVVFKSEKLTSNIIKRVYMLILKERVELDLEARRMGVALILNKSLDPLYEDYIKLNDLNEPLELRRNRVDDLEPTIKEGEVVDEPMIDIVKTRYNSDIIAGLDEYPSYCDFDRKIHIDCAYDLQFSCMIGRNAVGAFMNVPIFVGNFSIMTYFAIVENMDSYRDEGMDDIVVGSPFCKAAYIKARRFDGMITIYKGNDSVSAQDELKGISHPYQKLKGFYKEVLNLGSEYIKNEKVEEWLTRGYVSVHEME
nr:reverse transcriptase domain-containing protein [Tanacetum cinerariifolium]